MKLTRSIASTPKGRRGCIYDMHGSLCQWCEDWYGDYPNGDSTDARGAKTGTQRIVRGGSWYECAVMCRAAAGRLSVQQRNRVLVAVLRNSPWSAIMAEGQLAIEVEF